MNHFLFVTESHSHIIGGSSTYLWKIKSSKLELEIASNSDMSLTALDISLEGSQSPHDIKHFVPRRYQVKVFEVAKRKNIIAVLETGSGKTMIAVMLIKHIADQHIIKSIGHKKLIIFMAPTVHLVIQQYEVIKKSTTLEVGVYYGAKGVDDWSPEYWEVEVNTHNIMVMTPQILLDALRNAFLKIEMICLMVFDECHRATGNHPYTKIMKEFHHKSGDKPKIFGMTASPVIKKGVSSATDCEDQISQLESILDSQVYTVEDRTEIEEHVPSAVQICKFYDPTWLISVDLKAKMEALWSKFDASIMSKLQGPEKSEYEDINDKIKMLRKRLSNDYMKILYCLDDLGIVCAYEAVKVCLENAPDVKEECTFYRESSLQCRYFLDEVLNMISEFLQKGYILHTDLESDYIKAQKVGYISPKLHELLQIFHSFERDRQVLCLIFVERIVTAKVMQRYVKKLPCLSNFTASYLTGSTTSVDALAPKLQKEILESFYSGKVNLLFATDVVEEGIHVQNCSCVIRFDLPKTVRSYVQSRGRARKNDSQYIIMLERDNKKQRDHLFDIIRSEYSMTDTSRNRDPDGCNLRACNFEDANAYYVEATGASITPDSSVSLIYRYCEKLPGDRYFIPRPTFHFRLFEGLHQCEITLPPNAAFQTLVGPMSRNGHSSKQLVCLEACKILHQMGALDDHLLPLVEVPLDNEVIVKSKELSAGAGTTKRKELHGMTCIRALSGTWGEKVDGASFEAYKFEFSCNVDETYSGFVLLVEMKLDDDVGNTEVDLYLIAKMVKAYVSSCGKVHLSADQIKEAMCFQEFFFNGLFGRLFLGSEAKGTERKFLLQTEIKSLWCSSYSYLLLPTEASDSSNKKSWNIDWMGICSCANVVEFLRKHYSNGLENFKGGRGNILLSRTGSSMTDCKAENLVQFANSSIDVNDLGDMVVLAIHTGRIYSVIEVVSSISAESPLEENADTASSDYTYVEYFKTTYGIVLKYPRHPLLRLKQSHNAHNLLVDQGVSSPDGLVQEKQQAHVHMPPEILVSIDVRVDVLKSFYLLPSLMCRLESLMLASQIRKEINGQSSNFYISSSLILEALTTLRCCENFSLERLELLGDSVLKYAVSSYLFLKYPEKHEGQLTARRTRAICNSNLHKLGTKNKLQGYIRDGAFEPRRWAAPGQLSRFPDPCQCGVDTLEVPLDSRFQTEKAVKVGKFCDKGHRWMNSKTIADCVEALIGAYYVGGGLFAALHLMKWLSIDSETGPSFADEAITRASLRSYNPKTNELANLELKLSYEFAVKGLLHEAITHASQQKLGASYCYQRLEFLGDSVLDLLTTQHLYRSHTDIDPGVWTDLRSAAVSNENFAQAAIRQNLHLHLQHCSGLLRSHITEYERLLTEAEHSTSSVEDIKCPKALGDMVESIAGAILIDTKLNLDEVWRVFKPILSPIVTPSSLQLHPLRKLSELCDSLGYFVKETCTKDDTLVNVELSLQLEDVLLVGNGFDRSRKAAKHKAARQVLKALEKSIERREHYSDMDSDHCSNLTDEDFSEPMNHGKQNMTTIQSSSESKTIDPTQSNDCSNEVLSHNIATPVIGPIDTKKGEPRKSLFDLCKKLQWPMPAFTTTEQKSRTPIEFGEGSEKRIGFSSFQSKISLHIPNSCTIVCTGDPRADKKTSMDSAVVSMLHELQRRRKLVILQS
ncbi:putative ribonuclease III post-transcriptional gene silencing PAZ-Argonaute family [Rosa chinensis]|uniref:Putative ribonuclease III post-transcriptional gene silencing PAZ-Argonaute family n=1 Tax=Rosa chinensis TaxID=74649 RepID=A0A2P6PUE6_ROSCH|nr:putative ribonuclease III post-transcriptional gene silencing PAZ-Argonaute family [Rosa chinensis]